MDTSLLKLHRVVEDVFIEPRFLDSNIRRKLLDILGSKTGTVTKLYGTFIRFNELIAIHDSRISMSDSSIWLTVEYTFESQLPVVGEIYTGRLVDIFDKGALVEIKSIQCLLIGGSYTKPQKSDDPNQADRDVYVVSCCSMGLRKNDPVDIELIQTRYKSNRYICVGKHARCSKV